MKILVLGADGYLGRPTMRHFLERGDEVIGVDSLIKRCWEKEAGVKPLFPLGSFRSEFEEHPLATCWVFDISASPLDEVLESHKPDAIVHYAEQPSAPYSMMGRKKAIETQTNNVMGTLNLMFSVKAHCPDAHIVKLGTMGEYGTPNIDIEEGWLDVEHNRRRDRVLFPKRPGSFYHLSKCHDSANLEFGCRTWGQRVTDLNQGVVYGLADTSFHYDHIFGTVLNRFLAQSAIGSPLTVYGAGGQTRGFLNIKDTIQCVELAVDNPADRGEFRVFNQFTEQFSVMELAVRVAKLTGAEIQPIPNPRVEAEDHYYNAVHTNLLDLGLQPTLLTDKVLEEMYEEVLRHKDNIDPEVLKPTVRWNND